MSNQTAQPRNATASVRALGALTPSGGRARRAALGAPAYGPIKFQENSAADATNGLSYCSPALAALLELIAAGRVTEHGEAVFMDGHLASARDDVLLSDLWCAFLARHNPSTPSRWELTPLGAQTAALWSVRAHREQHPAW